MIRKPVQTLKQSEIMVIVGELNARGINEGFKGERLQSLDYFSLLRLLAIKEAVDS